MDNHPRITRLRSSPAVHVFLLIVLAGGVYVNSLGGKFIWDDSGLIIENIEYLEPKLDVQSLFLRSHFEAAPYYRPGLWLSFLIDYKLWKLNPLGFHITNIMLHILNTVLMYFFLRAIAATPAVAAAAGALFAVHPINTEAIAWIAGRNDPLLFLFLTLSCLCLCRFRRAPAIAGKTALLCCACISYGCALFAKESAVIAIPFFLLVEVWYLKKLYRPSRREAIAPYIALTIITVSFFMLRNKIIHQPFMQLSFQPDIRSFATPCIIYLYYIKTLFVPVNLTVDPSFLIRSMQSTSVILTCSAFCACLAAAAVLCSRYFREGLFGLLWILLYLAPVAGIVWMGIPILEHRAYGACAGFCFAAASLYHRFLVYPVTIINGYRVRLGSALLGIIVMLFSLMTIQRNALWKDEFTIWTDTLQKSPESAQALVNLGVTLLRLSKPEPALDLFRKALIASPRSARIYNNIGSALFSLGKYDEAQQAQEQALQLNPKSAEAYYNMGLLNKHRGNYEKAISCFQKAFALKPAYPAAHLNLGLLYEEQNDTQNALAVLHNALTTLPNNSPIYNALGRVYAKKNDFETAHRYYSKALSLDDSNYTAMNNITLLFIKLGRFREALPYAAQAVQIHSDAPELYLNLGIVFSNLERIEESIAAYKNALNLNEGYVDAHFNLAVILMRKQGQQKESVYHFKKVLLLKPDHPNKDLILEIIGKEKKQ